MTKEIQLTKGQIALVDDEDYEYLNQWRWKFGDTGYAVRTSSTGTIRMHRLVSSVSPDKEVDHINHNKLDNRKENLRVCNHSQNNSNKTKQINNTSGYKGVMWDKGTNKWRAKIAKDRKDFSIGRFSNLEEAARAYDKKALELHGEFANLNFPLQEQS